MAMRPRRPGLDEDGNLDESTLRRFVFQTFGRARRTQDSPVMPDVWLRYIRVAEKIARKRSRDPTVDLLITPWSNTRAGQIADQLRTRLKPEEKGKPGTARIALSDSRVVACVDFDVLVRDIVPMSGWWRRLRRKKETFDRTLDQIEHNANPRDIDIELARFAALVGFIDRLREAKTESGIRRLAALAHRLGPVALDGETAPEELDEGRELNGAERRLIYRRARELLQPDIKDRARRPVPPDIDVKDFGEIFIISLNRRASQTLFESRSTVKADAAQRLFQINTAGICFAIIDGGIDATHAAFVDQPENGAHAANADADAKPKKNDSTNDAQTANDGADTEQEENLKRSRVKETYDFTILRDIVAYADILCNPEERERKNLPAGANREALLGLAQEKENRERFDHLRIRNTNARDLDWEIVRPLIRVPHGRVPDEADEDEGARKRKGNGKGANKGRGWNKDAYRLPGTDHGTHVAGILAANLPSDPDSGRALIGMCPHLSLFDLRVFDANGRGDEFAILCAIEFVGWLNRDRANPVVHGVNLSLALAHDVDSFACGQTPICEAANHLVGAGTVVVAAAGNTGFEGSGGSKQQSMGTGYRAISITDPGNADSVITVGSTHRRDPHLYGVSYFSARGPTGDGRRKPDILAPGEKITSTVRNGSSRRMDGTSMAAPHVAGAAAMLMGRHPELIGQPQRIKAILMQTATDLRREASFQGAGLVDVLRALQSV